MSCEKECKDLKSFDDDLHNALQDINLLNSSLDVADINFPTEDDTDNPEHDSLNPLYSEVSDLTIHHITNTTKDGSGYFDILMDAYNTHIDKEYVKGRITGDQFASMYVTLLTSAMDRALEFALSKDTAKFGAIKAQMDARSAELESKIRLVNLRESKFSEVKAHYLAYITKVDYVTAQFTAAISSTQYQKEVSLAGQEEFNLCKLLPLEKDTRQFNLDIILPLQEKLHTEELETARGSTLDTRTDGTPIKGMLGRQFNVSEVDYDVKTFTLGNILPTQKAILQEQREAERAKTVDSRSDGDPIQGSIGRQKALHDQQIDSFQADSRYKVARLFFDAWATEKTMGTGVLVPDELTNAKIDEVVASVRSDRGLI